MKPRLNKKVIDMTQSIEAYSRCTWCDCSSVWCSCSCNSANAGPQAHDNRQVSGPTSLNNENFDRTRNSLLGWT